MPLKIAIVPVTPLQQNCTLLWDDETMVGAVCDPGGDIGRLNDAIHEAGFKLEKVLLTHGHLDHAGAAGELAKTHGVPIEGPHKDDLFLIETLPEQASKYGMPTYDLFEPTRWLDQGDTVTVGGLTLDVIHCPGHTPGHIVFHHEPSRIALVGDVIFQGSVGRTDFPRGNHQQLIDSIRDRLFTLGGDTGFVPGHGPLSTFEYEQKTNPYVSDEVLGPA
ncbi:MBL fold metallo-hydrolase [Pyruvatibacter sp.]|uniref:MBL fold metallo-hydrolase n=1 Tax=Pyruvatibacter sp. TaxID=1981328 RepID=UPI003267F77D